jgi:dienelactone hydrolase
MRTIRNLLASLVLACFGGAACSHATAVRDTLRATSSERVFEANSSSPSSQRLARARAATRADHRAVSVLAAPDGPFTVGVMDAPLPNSIVYYPADPHTGTGPHRYLDPKLIAAMGLPEQFSALTTTSRTKARPQRASFRRPVVVLSPGFGSVMALSTSLAEHLASHGYVVVAVQADIVAEAAAVMPNEAQAKARRSQIEAALALIEDPAFAEMVGAVDVTRIAIGGHSYAGSVAFNMSLRDPRVSAVFDLDGLLFDEAAKVATTVPSLVVTSGGGTQHDPVLRRIVASGTNTVAVGLVGARHSDLTDAAAIAPMLREAGIPADLGSIGPTATISTSKIVQRFLDAALGETRHPPTSAALVAGLPATTTDAFATRP